jgi:hypothetical protein
MTEATIASKGLIEGIGDEVLMGVVALFGLVIPMMAYVLNR